jgi:hypothetical protein
MNVLELFTFLLLCVGLGFLGRFFSHHWCWLAGAIPAGVVLVVMLIASIKELVKGRWPPSQNQNRLPS